MKKPTIKKRGNELMKLENVNKMYQIIALLLLSVTSVFSATQDSLKLDIDRNPVNLKEFPNDLSEKYSSKEFDYDVVEGKAENFLSQLLRWFFEGLADLFGFQVSPGVFLIIKILFYSFLGILIVYIAMRLLLGEGAASFFTRKDVTVTPLTFQEQHIENIDLDAYIKDALSEKNYRLAIRYMFLKSLKHLSGKQLIDWHFEKTNLDYYHELEDDILKNNFKQTAYLYDNIWYGEYLLDAAGFEKAKIVFDQLNKRTEHVR